MRSPVTRFGMSGPRIVQGLTPLTSRRQARGVLRRLGGVSVLRRSALGDDRRAVAVRDVLEPAPNAERADYASAGDDVHLLRVELPQPLCLVRSGRGVEQRAGESRPRPPPDPHPSRGACWCTGSTPPVETPFIDVANRFITDSSTVAPELIAHKSWTQLAGGLTDPSNVSTQAIAGEAEVLTAEVCEATGGNPAAVCSSTVVQQYEAALPTLTGKGGSCPAPPGPGGPPPARRRRGERAPGHAVGSDRHRRALRRLMARRRHTDDLDVCNMLG